MTDLVHTRIDVLLLIGPRMSFEALQVVMCSFCTLVHHRSADGNGNKGFDTREITRSFAVKVACIFRVKALGLDLAGRVSLSIVFHEIYDFLKSKYK